MPPSAAAASTATTTATATITTAPSSSGAANHMRPSQVAGTKRAAPDDQQYAYQQAMDYPAHQCHPYQKPASGSTVGARNERHSHAQPAHSRSRGQPSAYAQPSHHLAQAPPGHYPIAQTSANGVSGSYAPLTTTLSTLPLLEYGHDLSVLPQSSASGASKRPSNTAAARERDRSGPGSFDARRAPNGSTSKTSAQAAGSSRTAATTAANAATEPNGPGAVAPESKKDKKRREVIDRIHRVHWDTVENREMLYQDLYHALSAQASTLLTSPSRSRSYLLALTSRTLARERALRESALLHAHQLESARAAYEHERARIDDEARAAKKGVREKLLAAVEERRRRLREEKEGGEVTVDFYLDASARPHATRKLRNKGSSRRAGRDDSPPPAHSRLGGLSALAAEGGGGAQPGVGNSVAGGASLQELLALSGLGGRNASGAEDLLSAAVGGAGSAQSFFASRFGLSSSANGLGDLGLGLHLVPPDAGILGDSSYMSGARAAAAPTKSKKKGGKSAAAAAAAAAAGAGNGGDGDEDGGGSSRAAAAAAAAAVGSIPGTGRLRWDVGKSLSQLTGAKDFEVEGDLINIRKSGGKRRRR